VRVKEGSALQPVVAAPRQAWLRLLDRAPNASIYLHPDLVAGGGALVYSRGDRSDLEALAVLAPKRVRLGRLPGLDRVMVLEGRRLVGDCVLGASDRPGAGAFLAEAMRLFDDRAIDCLYLEDLEVGSPLWDQASELGQAGRVRVLQPSAPQPHWWIRFPEVAADYWKQFSSKSRNTLRRKVKKLEHRLVSFRAPESVPEFLERAHQVSRHTWQSRRLGLRVKSSPEERQLYGALAERGALRSYVLEHRGRSIAFLIGVRYRDHFRYEEVGYHPELADRSPGTVLLSRVLEDLIADDCPALFDFGAGDADYKRQFANHQTETGPLLLVSRALRPSAVVAAFRARQAADQRIRSLLRRTGLYQRLRRLYRRR
jgi:CelD/BcsL family acetyltransferase involved in cellulose biosynthesis